MTDSTVLAQSEGLNKIRNRGLVSRSDWQSEGQGFESPRVHQITLIRTIDLENGLPERVVHHALDLLSSPASGCSGVTGAGRPITAALGIGVQPTSPARVVTTTSA